SAGIATTRQTDPPGEHWSTPCILPRLAEVQIGSSADSTVRRRTLMRQYLTRTHALRRLRIVLPLAVFFWGTDALLEARAYAAGALLTGSTAPRHARIDLT